jgi:phospholipid/cholesterol/gamma-HCH transport system substrate-binding protein
MSPSSRDAAAARRVGLLVLAALAVGAAALVVLGDRQQLFVPKHRYRIRLASVYGLTEGSTVQLSGVKVGSVERIVLPADMGENLLEVWIAVDARYEQRIRRDSVARIKTLGLLGDKYLEITSGSPTAPELAEGDDLAAAPMTDVDRLAATGEDAVNNIQRISSQLANILGKIERGEGLLGKLLIDEETSDRVSTELDATLAAVRKLAQGLDDRQGTLGRLVHDRAMAERLAQSIERLDALLAKADSADGLLPALLSDLEQKERFERALASFERASTKLAELADALAQEESEALLPKLVHDQEYGERVAGEIDRLLANLRQISEKINSGEGSAARLVNDETLARALEDVVIGVDDSRFLRWLVRNRRKRGEEVRSSGAPPPEEPPPEP